MDMLIVDDECFCLLWKICRDVGMFEKEAMDIEDWGEKGSGLYAQTRFPAQPQQNARNCQQTLC